MLLTLQPERNFQGKRMQPGDKFIKLGEMLNDPTSTMQQIVTAGIECGLIVTFRVEPDPANCCEINSDGSENCQCNKAP